MYNICLICKRSIPVMAGTYAITASHVCISPHQANPEPCLETYTASSRVLSDEYRKRNLDEMEL